MKQPRNQVRTYGDFGTRGLTEVSTVLTCDQAFSFSLPTFAKKGTPYSSPIRGIFADVIVYIFAHLHRALHTEGKVLDIN